MSLLFSPYRLGGLELANRLVVSPMCQYSAVDGLPVPWHFMHLGSMSVSGAGLVIVEATAVEAVGRISPGCLGLWNEPQEAALTRLLQEVRSYSEAKIGIQLCHAGRKGSCPPGWAEQRQIPIEEGGWQTVGPSALAFGPEWQVPDALDEAGLERVRDAFVQAAIRADRCGFDHLEVHAAHGYLLSQFLSPIANLREDRYGGDLERRMAFPLAVMRAIRDIWPRHKALGVRLNATELDDRAITLEQALEHVRAFGALGVDYVTMSAGNAVPGRTYPPLVPGYQVVFAERAKREAGATAMAVGMILKPTQAESILAEGRADLIAIARAFLDNPRWGWHAAKQLGDDLGYPLPYTRARNERWPGYALLHDGS